LSERQQTDGVETPNGSTLRSNPSECAEDEPEAIGLKSQHQKAEVDARVCAEVKICEVVLAELDAFVRRMVI
jgi:hypothetical protein